MYRRIASELELEIVKKPDDPPHLSMVFPKQEGLRTDVLVCLESRDELWFVIEDFTCSMFPFEEIKDEFERRLRKALTGEYRVRKFARRGDGKVFKSLLQQNSGDRWVTVYTYGRMISLFPTFFYDVSDEFLTHDQADGNNS